MTSYNTEIDCKIPADAWWAMDYHFDWLVGALHLYRKEYGNSNVTKNETNLIKGNQEDVDLIVCFKQTLILIEAKATSGWNEKQLHSKFDRFEAILKLKKELPLSELKVFLVLMSPRKPSLKKPILDRLVGDLEGSKDKGEFNYLPLVINDPNPKESGLQFSRVTRCKDNKGVVGKSGEFWKIVKVPNPSAE